jgi:PPK2 family polyphosphate:nucleotide phosphotransferase
MATENHIAAIPPGKHIKLASFDPSLKPPGMEQKPKRLKALGELSTELDRLQDVFYAAHSHKLLLVLQGMDTAGKDGTIRHVFRTVDPLGVRVASFKTPTPTERDHDFLWRIHAQAPANGEIVIFNRSHYEDVLITRVHNWIDAPECKRRYAQINAFEHMLAQQGTLIVKCFLHISRDEQRGRLRARLQDATKHWKFNAGDLEERTLWEDYQAAYENALSATSTEWAPWHVIPANSKSSRNVFIAQLLVAKLRALKLTYPVATVPKEKIHIN